MIFNLTKQQANVFRTFHFPRNNISSIPTNSVTMFTLTWNWLHPKEGKPPKPDSKMEKNGPRERPFSNNIGNGTKSAFHLHLFILVGGGIRMSTESLPNLSLMRLNGGRGVTL